MQRVSFIWIVFITLIFTIGSNVRASPTNIFGPAGSSAFGWEVKVLPNGNFVVTDPYYDEGNITDVGAVYFYDGATLSVISVLKGSRQNDNVGTSITILPNGNFVVTSPNWDMSLPINTNVGAVTLCNGTTGCAGIVSAANSLIGSSSEDQVGTSGIYPLINGNYVVRSLVWNNGNVTDTGAVTLCDGNTGCIGQVSPSNSLVGSTSGDIIGGDGIFARPNGNFVVLSDGWSNGTTYRVGAVTLCDGTSGCNGAVNESNSLIGMSIYQSIGYGGITALTNGN